MVTKSHDLPLQLRARGIREKWMQAVCRGERRHCRAPPPHPQITQNRGSCQAPPYSSLDPKKPQELPGESSFHENTGWEKVPKGKGTGADVPRTGVFLGQWDPQVEVCTTSQTQSATAKRSQTWSVSSTLSLTGWLRLLPTVSSMGGPGGSGASETTHTQPETAPWAGPLHPPPQVWA